MSQLVLNLINGELCPSKSDQWLPLTDPSTARVYGNVADSSEEDLSLAMASATEAFKEWSRSPPSHRAMVLLKISDLILANLDELANAECLDTGKPLDVAKTVDIARAAENFKFFAHNAALFSSESHTSGHQLLNYTIREPLGVVACISPWNLPLYLFTWKIAPALAAGNCVIGKPSELTPLTASILGRLCGEAGLPPGVLSILNGQGSQIGRMICDHPGIKAVSFTGGTETGKLIAAQAGANLKKSSLELGGKNPALVFADCDLEFTVRETVRAAFSNQGQICLCGSRIYVEDSIFEDFLSKFVKTVKADWAPGDPLTKGVRTGAVVSEAHKNKILSFIDLAKKEGARVHCGGKSANLPGRCESGYFIEPTVLTGLEADCAVNQEEIFGPVVTIGSFQSEEEAVNLANNSQYGLSATIWTKHLDRGHRLAQQIDVGIVWVNGWLLRDLRTPFGGNKQSGLGREGGLEAMRFFTSPKNVCINLSGH